MTRDEVLAGVEEMRSKVREEGYRGPFILAAHPRTVEEIGGLPDGSLPSDVRLVTKPFVQPDMLYLVRAEEFERQERESDLWYREQIRA